MKIILVGIQGSGKSTQGNLLSEKLQIPYLSTGQIFRGLAREKTPLGLEIKKVMNAGLLIPDDRTLKIVSEYLRRPEYKKGYILDGFPRTLIQVESFKDGVDKVVYINISDKEAHKRIKARGDSSREDEAEEAVKERINSFHKYTEPVLDYYRNNNILIEVDGKREIDDIHEEIMSKIGN